MKRPLQLRQIEAFKAVVETGSVTAAANVLAISQPSVSKLISHLEEDAGLQLFERVRGRLVPSERGIRLYEEVDRTFAGLRQIERAIDSIQREDIGQLSVGVLPALTGHLTQQATSRFLAKHPDAYVSILGRSSQVVIDWLVRRQIDVGIVNAPMENPYLNTVPLTTHPLICIMPRGHRLASKHVVTPQDIAGTPFIALASENKTRVQIEARLAEHRVQPRIVADANLTGTICEFVAAGLGISILDPVFVHAVRDRVEIRRLSFEIETDLWLCYPREARNKVFVETFLRVAQEAIEAMMGEIFSGLPGS